MGRPRSWGSMGSMGLPAAMPPAMHARATMAAKRGAGGSVADAEVKHGGPWREGGECKSGGGSADSGSAAALKLPLGGAVLRGPARTLCISHAFPCGAMRHTKCPCLASLRAHSSV